MWDALRKIAYMGEMAQDMWASINGVKGTLEDFRSPVPIHNHPPAMPMPPPVPLPEPVEDLTVPLVIGAMMITLVLVLIVYGLCSCANLSLLIIKTNIVTLPVNIVVTLFILFVYHTKFGATPYVPPIYQHPQQGYHPPYGYQGHPRHP